jgi:hypothetical protein
METVRAYDLRSAAMMITLRAAFGRTLARDVPEPDLAW